MGTLEEYTTAARMRDLLEQTAKGVLDRERPRYSYATVQSIDLVNNTCMVQFAGDPQAVPVGMGSTRPTWIGQTVRIEGLLGDRYIADVMNPNFIPPLESWHTVGAVGEPAFQNGWANYTTLPLTSPVGFIKDQNGVVWLRGVIRSGGPNGSIAFQLPPAYAPGVDLWFPAWSNSTLSIIFIYAAGQVAIYFDNTGVTLDAIKFPTTWTPTTVDSKFRKLTPYLNGWLPLGNTGNEPLVGVWRREDGFCLGVGNLGAGTVNADSTTLTPDCYPIWDDIQTSTSWNGAVWGAVRTDVGWNNGGIRQATGGMNSIWSLCGLDWVSNELEYGQWTDLALLNSWLPYGGTTKQNAGFCKPTAWLDPYGIVHVRGLIKAGTFVGGTALANLPLECWPEATRYFISSANGVMALLRIDNDGVLRYGAGLAGASNAFLSMHATYPL